MKIDKNIIKELSEYLDEFNLTEIEIAEKDKKIKISKNKISTSVQSTNLSSSLSDQKENTFNKANVNKGIEITSPIIGTAYHSPEPGAKKFVEVGKKIKKGDTIMIIEAMKTMNHIPSTTDGIVKEVCVKDGQPVEYGQTIVILE